MSSLSQVQVEKIERIWKHENADSLECLALTNGFTVIDKIGKFQVSEKCAYVPVDMQHKDKECPDYEFLGKGRRVRGKKIRGIISCGLVLKLDHQDYELNTDLSEQFGFIPYEAPEPSRPGASLGKVHEVKPPIQVSKYDIESLRKYWRIFEPEIVVTEKIHGTNSNFLYHTLDEVPTFYCKTRTRWLKSDGDSVWCKVVRQYNLEEKLKEAPNIMLCGEIFGQVQDLKYGADPGELFFAAFDAYIVEWGKFMDYDDLVALCDRLEIPRAPEVYRGKWQSLDHIKELSERKTAIGKDLNQIAEGVVVKLTKESWNQNFGRTILKLPSNSYLTRK